MSYQKTSCPLDSHSQVQARQNSIKTMENHTAQLGLTIQNCSFETVSLPVSPMTSGGLFVCLDQHAALRRSRMQARAAIWSPVLLEKGRLASFEPCRLYHTFVLHYMSQQPTATHVVASDMFARGTEPPLIMICSPPTARIWDGMSSPTTRTTDRLCQGSPTVTAPQRCAQIERVPSLVVCP